MAHKLPYVNSTKLIGTVLDKIQEAPTPPKFTLDFLKHKLGVKTSSARAIPPLLIKLGFLAEDRTPTEAYNEFRNEGISKQTMATAIKRAFGELYECSEYAHDLPDNDLKSLVLQLTGLEKNSRTLVAIVGTFKALKEYADFESEPIQSQQTIQTIESCPKPEKTEHKKSKEPVGMNLAYTINLNLPETSDIKVFDAIFKSLKENLL